MQAIAPYDSITAAVFVLIALSFISALIVLTLRKHSSPWAALGEFVVILTLLFVGPVFYLLFGAKESLH
ncbi:hypothetical protein [Corynebacterium ulceribovis]|uniref:hypothetical protein n=1 Tax=Corynebacterium ulceribovis TaxID=487732 RepID=UPI000360655B|nr:hypothetical protein [Corynebacterium ulceribovis]